MNLKFWHRSSLSRPSKDKHASSPGLLARLRRDEDGSYLLYMVFVLPVLIGVGGLAGEGSLLFYNHRSLQSAADAAAFSAALAYSYDTSADITTQAEAVVVSYGFTLGTGTDANKANVAPPQIIPNYAGSANTAITVLIARPQTAIFARTAGLSTLPNSVSATAVISGSGAGNCLLALGNTATGNNAANAIKLQGNPTVSVPSCGVFSNSTSTSSIALGGSADLIAGSVGTAGTLSGASDLTLPPGVTYTQGDLPLADPYAGVSIPATGSAGSCSGNVCSPGVYSTGLSLKGGTYTLQPGVYIMEGEFKVGPGGGGTTVNGNGVTVVFTSATPNNPRSYPSTMVAFDSLANVNLTAPTTGPTAGFVIMGDHTMPLGTAFSTQSNPNVTLNGTVYVPRGAFDWNGNPATLSTMCLQYVVNTISFRGDSGLNASGCSLGAGQKQIGSVVTLVD